jgi:hypothetical protein
VRFDASASLFMATKNLPAFIEMLPPPLGPWGPDSRPHALEVEAFIGACAARCHRCRCIAVAAVAVSLSPLSLCRCRRCRCIAVAAVVVSLSPLSLCRCRRCRCVAVAAVVVSRLLSLGLVQPSLCSCAPGFDFPLSCPCAAKLNISVYPGSVVHFPDVALACAKQVLVRDAEQKGDDAVVDIPESHAVRAGCRALVLWVRACVPTPVASCRPRRSGTRRRAARWRDPR